jgi:hypothetical protein
MKNPLLWTVALLPVVVFAAQPLPAQTVRLSVDIPFEFVVGQETMPAGKYKVVQMAPSVMLLRSVDTGSASMFLTIGAKGRGLPAVGKLVFNRYGDVYFLSRIWSPGSDIGRELPRSRYERELASSRPALPHGEEVLASSFK